MDGLAAERLAGAGRGQVPVSLEKPAVVVALNEDSDQFSGCLSEHGKKLLLSQEDHCRFLAHTGGGSAEPMLHL